VNLLASSRATYYNVVRVEASTGRVADDCCDCLDHGATKSTVHVGLHVPTVGTYMYIHVLSSSLIYYVVLDLSSTVQ